MTVSVPKGWTKSDVPAHHLPEPMALYFGFYYYVSPVHGAMNLLATKSGSRKRPLDVWDTGRQDIIAQGL